MKKLPQANNTQIIVQEAGAELLIYNLKNNRAYSLNETSKIIFNACDGKTTFAELKNKHQFSDDLIYLSLDGLKKNNLIEDSFKSPFAGLSRREAIKKAGLTSLSSLTLLPIILNIVAPTAIQAQSQSCIADGQPSGTPVFYVPVNNAAYCDTFGFTENACCSNTAIGVVLFDGNRHRCVQITCKAN